MKSWIKQVWDESKHKEFVRIILNHVRYAIEALIILVGLWIALIIASYFTVSADFLANLALVAYVLPVVWFVGRKLVDFWKHFLARIRE